MNFYDYLETSKTRATEEKDVLDYLSDKNNLDRIEVRAAKNSFQVLIENLIGKSKKILKYFNCPIIPQRSKDSIYILYEVGVIDDIQYKEFNSAIGFRNIMIHDYLEFNEDILKTALKEKKYKIIFDFIVQDDKFSQTVIKRIENFSF